MTTRGDPDRQFDLVVRGGTVVTEDGSRRANVAIRGPAIAAISDHELAGRRVIDAGGLLVLPGGVDAHTHFNSVWPFPDERRPADDFESGTRGAAAGGITTVCDFVYPLDGETLAQAIRRVTGAASAAYVDFALHVAITTLDDSILRELDTVVAAGCISFKFYTSHPDFVVNGSHYLRLMARLAELGGIAMFHCEDRAILEYRRELLLAAGRSAPRFYPESKPVEAEIAATTNAICMAAVAGLPSYIVHLSSSAALDAVAAARVRGADVRVETRPLYLYLTAREYDAEDATAARYIGTPPLRTGADQARLWQALRDGVIDTVGSDHVGFTAEQKYRVGDTFDTVPKGTASTETLLPMLFSVGVRGGRIPVERFVQLVATNPARIFGIFPAKGTIAVGSDADLCVLDPEERRRLSGAELHSAADAELFEGLEVTGWPVYTISRGEVIHDRGVIVGQPGRGSFVPGLAAPRHR